MTPPMPHDGPHNRPNRRKGRRPEPDMPPMPEARMPEPPAERESRKSRRSHRRRGPGQEQETRMPEEIVAMPEPPREGSGHRPPKGRRNGPERGHGPEDKYFDHRDPQRQANERFDRRGPHGSEIEKFDRRGPHGPEDEHVERRGPHGPKGERFDRRPPHGPEDERFDHRLPHGPHEHEPDHEITRREPGRLGMPNGDMLRQRVAEAGLAELLRLSGRLLPHGPGANARGQTLILSILAGRESLSQRELQQMLGVQPGSVSEIVTKLENKGYLSREKSGGRRGNVLRITDEGRRAIPKDASDDDIYFAALTAQQQSQLNDLLRTLLNDWIDKMP